MISVVIRNKNEAKSLEFLLKVLNERYSNDITEIIVLDNCSTDNSKTIAAQYNARFVTIEKFSYGGSANKAAQLATQPVVVIFSAHSYPVSHDFFTLIKARFQGRNDLAGLRCIQNMNDYRNFVNNVSVYQDPNISGLHFAGSAFSREVWKLLPFNEALTTYEDKEWTIRALAAGYKIEMVSSVLFYSMKRSPSQHFFRYKNETIGNYQIWGEKYETGKSIRLFFTYLAGFTKTYFTDVYYTFRRLWFILHFIKRQPKNIPKEMALRIKKQP